MQYRRKEIAVLTGVLFTLLVIISLQVRTGDNQSLFHNACYRIASPFVKSGHFIAGKIGSFFTYFTETGTIRDKNERLKDELSHLKTRLQLTKFLETQNEELKKLLEYKDTAGFKTMAVHVISRDILDRYRSLTINKGSIHGIEKDFPVITPEGVLGRVIGISYGSSLVQLITDADSGTAGFSPRTGENVMVLGTNGPQPEVRYVPNVSEIKKGDIILTSGYDSIYPEGLVIGTVSVSEPGEFGTRRISLKPAASIMKSRELLVVLDR